MKPFLISVIPATSQILVPEGSGYLLRTDAWSYPVLRLKRLGLSKTFRRLVITLTRRYGVSLIHLDASAECLPGLPTFNW
ncbi:TPA: hypothetical protein JLB74_002986 [Escherichia coli]|nr:hypothetical protein HVZ25_19160 [Escherichia coli]HAV8180753.1 hypothetical protein [Escherichia coli]HAW0978006.1 hypothetical protein [Escherichia coli]HAW2055516.1 hypothetical protein [Escherichia coli]